MFYVMPTYLSSLLSPIYSFKKDPKERASFDELLVLTHDILVHLSPTLLSVLCPFLSPPVGTSIFGQLRWNS